MGDKPQPLWPEYWRPDDDLPQWALVAGWWCVTSLASVDSCLGPRASLSLALSACTGAVYRCISSASPAGSNREHRREGRGRLAGETGSLLRATSERAGIHCEGYLSHLCLQGFIVAEVPPLKQKQTENCCFHTSDTTLTWHQMSLCYDKVRHMNISTPSLTVFPPSTELSVPAVTAPMFPCALKETS